MRRREGAGDHRLRGAPTHAADRYARFPLASRFLRGGALARGCRRASPSGDVFDVSTRDEPVGTRGRDQGDIHAELLGQLPHRWSGPRSLGEGVGGRVGQPDRVMRCGLEDRRVGAGARFPGRGTATTSPCGCADGRSVADEVCRHGLILRLPGRSDLDGIPLAPARSAGPVSSGVARRSSGVDAHQDGTHVDDVARRRVQCPDHPGEGRGDLHDGLGRLDLGERLIQRHRVALGDVPLHDLGLGQPFTQVREPEVLAHRTASSASGMTTSSSNPVGLAGRPSTRSTASRIRSRSGRCSASSFAGG